MKHRVIKEMPYYQVGSITLAHWFEVHGFNLQMLIKDGWIEEVKEESLEEKLSNWYRQDESMPPECFKEMSQIAKDHHIEIIRNMHFGLERAVDERENTIKAIEDA